jgi:hypothetical protein
MADVRERVVRLPHVKGRTFRRICAACAALRGRIASDIAKWSRIVEAAGIKPN